MKTRRTHAAGRRAAAVAPETRPRSVPKAWRRRAFATAAAVVIGGSSSLLACPFCFGAQETALVDGTKLGILVLLIIVLVVQGAFAGFFFYLRQRAKHMADADLDLEWSELQGGASR